jgi:hypothetical protein
MAYPEINLHNNPKLPESQKSDTGDYFKKYIRGNLVKSKGKSVPVKKTGDGENTEKSRFWQCSNCK